MTTQTWYACDWGQIKEGDRVRLVAPRNTIIETCVYAIDDEFIEIMRGEVMLSRHELADWRIDTKPEYREGDTVDQGVVAQLPYGSVVQCVSTGKWCITTVTSPYYVDDDGYLAQSPSDGKFIIKHLEEKE